jgi:lysyl-tRNA synthetase class 2
VLRHAARIATGSAVLSYAGRTVDLDQPFARLSVGDALVAHAGLTATQAHDEQVLRERLAAAGVPAPAHWRLAELQFGLFEAVVEEKLWEPTFIIDYPVELSPLSRRKPGEDGVVERFEAFCGGMEISNGFSELNDPDDQRARFEEQAEMGRAGDDEAHPVDEDYVTALEYGLPPTGGVGLGIDRLAMLLTGQETIREVVLFPAMRT